MRMQALDQDLCICECPALQKSRIVSRSELSLSCFFCLLTAPWTGVWLLQASRQEEKEEEYKFEPEGCKVRGASF